MPACPNCGRQTLRTRDWACQWCGYPLLSRAYKKIDKTFKQLQEERSASLRSAYPAPEPETETETEYGPVPETAPQAPPAYQHPVKPAFDFRPEPAAAPVRPPEPEERRQPEAPPSISAPRAEIIVTPRPAPVAPPAQMAPPAPVAPPPPAPQLAPPPAPQPPPLPAPVAVAPPSLDSIDDGSVLSVDQLDALYAANRLGVHSKLLNKTIVVTGFVEKVFIRDHIDVRYIVLTGARKNVTWPVRCNFDKESISRMERLTEGQEVSLRGRYDGYGKNIIFKECVLA